MLDFFEQDKRQALQMAGARPAAGADPGAAEAFGAGFADARSRHFWADDRSKAQYLEPYLQRIKDVTGIQPPSNPETLPREVRGAIYTKIRRDVEAWNIANPTNPVEFPDDDQIAEGGASILRGEREEAAGVSARGTSLTSSAAGVAGGMAGAIADPINAISMAFGASASAGILRTALTEAGIGLVTQSAIELKNYQLNQRVDPDFGLGDAAGSVASATAGGFVLGGAIKSLASAWFRVRNGRWPSHVRDAGNLVQREAAVPPPPVDRTPQGEAAHRGRLEAAAEDIAAGRPIGESQQSFLKQDGRSGRVFDAEGRSVDVEYQVVEASSLTTSNLDDFSVNPAFPAELQPRDRGRALSQDQVINIAARLQPERLGPSPSADSGAPIVGPDGIVESGNGRVMAIRRAYELNQSRANNYRDFLKAQGFDVEGFENPVLIARRVSELTQEQRQGFVNAANQATALRLGAAEQALSDARHLTDDVLSKLQDGDVGNVRNRQFVSEFMKRLPRSEQGGLIDADGQLSQEGVKRIQAAIMGRAFGEPALLSRALEDRSTNIKAIAGALTDAGGGWAQMRDAVGRGELPAGMDITRDLVDAIRLVMRARDEGRPIAELAGQAEMFAGPSEISKLLLRAMFNDDFKRPVSRQRVAEVLKDYADEARKNTAGDRLFGEPLEASEVLNTALAKAGREDLLSEVVERTTPDKAQELMDSPEAADAVIQEAQRLRAAASGGETTFTRSDLVEPDGTTRKEGASDDLIAQTQSVLDRGGTAALEIEGKEIPIVGTRQGQFVDAEGKRWGVLGSLAFVEKGKENRLILRQAAKEPLIEFDGVERSLADWLDEADDEIAAAKEIEACAIGKDAAE